MLSSLGSIASHIKAKQSISPYPAQNTLLSTKGTVRTQSHWYFAVSASRNYIVCTIPTPGSAPRGIFVSNNGGASHTNVVTISDNFSYIAMSNSGKYIYVMTDKKVYYSSNNGVSFNNVSVTGAVNLASITCNSNGDTVFVVDYSNGVIFRSTDYGVSFSSWKSFGVASSTVLIYCEPINCLFTSTNSNTSNHVHKYDINADTVTRYKPNTSGNNNANWIAVSSNGQYIYVMYASESGTNQLYKSSNYGTSWTSTTVLSGTTLNDPVYCSPNGKYVYVRNSATSVVISQDYGASWTNNTNFTGFGVNMNQYGNTLYAVNGSQYCLGT